MKVRLIVVEGKPLGREIPVPSTVFVIGRDAQCHLRPHSKLVSKLHCAIARKAGKVVVRDLQSSNGTLINGQPITEEVAINDGDQLGVGDLVFAFRIDKSDDTQPVQIVDEREVKWLINTPSDSSVLQSPCRTVVVKESSALGKQGAKAGAGDGGASGESMGSKAVSAGQYLRDYLDKRR
jgi:pSer/pThr/pTyr-binding forkhead associated (FHA) protein